MTLASSGSLSMNDIAGEFGGRSDPESLSEFYRGGSRVPAHSNTTSIPSSGTIQIDDFYGTSLTSPLDLAITFTHGDGNSSQGKSLFRVRGYCTVPTMTTACGSIQDSSVAGGGFTATCVNSFQYHESGYPWTTSNPVFAAWQVAFDNTSFMSWLDTNYTQANFTNLGTYSYDSFSNSTTNGFTWGGFSSSNPASIKNAFYNWTANQRQGNQDTVTFS